MFKSILDYFMNWYWAVDKLRKAQEEDLKTLREQIQDLKKENEQLKKKRECALCGSKEEPLMEFHGRLKMYSYPSYMYCSDPKCVLFYIEQIESLLKG